MDGMSKDWPEQSEGYDILRVGILRFVLGLAQVIISISILVERKREWKDYLVSSKPGGKRGSYSCPRARAY